MGDDIPEADDARNDRRWDIGVTLAVKDADPPGDSLVIIEGLNCPRGFVKGNCHLL